jgi:hypothetical protein
MMRFLVFGAVWLVISCALFFATPGCYGRNCEGSIEVFGVDAGQGNMVDENTWESSPNDGVWLSFPRQRYYIFDIRALGGRTPTLYLPYLSASPEPQKSGFDNTLAAGNLAKFKNVSPNHIEVLNDTCSDFFLRLVVQVPESPPSVTGVGVGVVETDAGASDAADASDGD